MRKSTMFIAATLTVFVMAILAGVVSAYQGVVVRQSSPKGQLAALPMPANWKPLAIVIEEPKPQVVTPEEATTIAMDFLGASDVYSVEVTEYEGSAAYLVTFSSGDLVYVNAIGEVVANSTLEPVVVIASVNTNNGGGGQSNSDNGSSNTQNRHDDDDDHDDDHDDHEEHDDDDD